MATMSNEEKAAIMLLSLSEDVAAAVMKNMRPSEIRRVGKYMSRISTIPAETVNAVAKEFISLAKERGGTIAIQDGAAKTIVMKALGEKDAQTILADVESAKSGADNPIIDKLRDVDPKVLMDFTRTEHPQTIALILAHLKPEQAAEMLENFSPALQGEILRRMATLKSVPSEYIEEIARTLEKEIVIGGISDHQVGGIRVTSEILNRMSRSSESAVMGALEEKDPELANAIRSLMFTFEDVLKLDDKSLQELLKEVSGEDLSRSLKMVDDTQRQKFYRNMSKRGAEMLKEDIEMMPPIRVSEVEASQRSILDTVKRLESEGRIVLLRGGEADEFV